MNGHMHFSKRTLLSRKMSTIDNRKILLLMAYSRKKEWLKFESKCRGGKWNSEGMKNSGNAQTVGDNGLYLFGLYFPYL